MHQRVASPLLSLFIVLFANTAQGSLRWEVSTLDDWFVFGSFVMDSGDVPEVSTFVLSRYVNHQHDPLSYPIYDGEYKLEVNVGSDNLECSIEAVVQSNKPEVISVPNRLSMQADGHGGCHATGRIRVNKPNTENEPVVLTVTYGPFLSASSRLNARSRLKLTGVDVSEQRLAYKHKQTVTIEPTVSRNRFEDELERVGIGYKVRRGQLCDAQHSGNRGKVTAQLCDPEQTIVDYSIYQAGEPEIARHMAVFGEVRSKTLNVTVQENDKRPNCVSWAKDRIDCVARGPDKRLKHRALASGRWSPWTDLGGQLSSAPVVSSWASGRLDAFARGLNGNMWHRWYDGEWRDWMDLGGGIATTPACVSSAVPRIGQYRIDCFARGQDRRVKYRSYVQGGRWSAWQDLGGQISSAPTVASGAYGQLDVFARGMNGNLFRRRFDGSWRNWEDLGGDIGSSPACVSWANERIDCFALGQDSQLKHIFYNGAWSRWGALGGRLTSAPTVSSWSPGRLDVFSLGLNGRMWCKWYEGSWSKWVELGSMP